MKKITRLVLLTAFVTALNMNLSALPVQVTVSQTLAKDETPVLVEGQMQTAIEEVLTGEGTLKNPYVISTAADFVTAANMVAQNNVAYGADVYSLESCVDFDGVEFVPIGTQASPFRGTLLGNNHKIKNIAISDVANFGVVGYMTTGTISNLHAEYSDGKYTTEKLANMGGIVGFVEVSVSTPVYISGCSASGNVDITSSRALNLGGNVGLVKAKSGNIYVSDSVSYMNLTATVTASSKIGGFVGESKAESGKHYSFENCISYGDATASITADNGSVGGFVGDAFADEKHWSGWGEITSEDVCFYRSIAFGDVYLDSNDSCSVGGFVASVTEHVKIETCYTSSNQTVTSKKITTPSTQVVCEDANLRSSTYLSENLKFDFKNTFVMDKDGVVRLANECETCVLYPDPKIVFTESGVKAKGIDGEYVLVISKNTGGVMSGIKFVDVNIDGEITYEDAELNVQQGDIVKAFLFESKQSVMPVCESISTEL